MSRTMIAAFLSAGLGFAGVGMAQMHSPMTYPTPMSKADYTRVAIEKCDSLAGAAKDTCVSAAKSQYEKQ